MQLRPPVGLQRELAAVPWAPAHLHSGFEQGELVCPGGEAAVAAVGMELCQDRDECVVCRLHGEIIDAVRAGDGDRRPSPADLEAGRAQEQRVQTLDGVVALASSARQPSYPRIRLDVERLTRPIAWPARTRSCCLSVGVAGGWQGREQGWLEAE